MILRSVERIGKSSTLRGKRERRSNVLLIAGNDFSVSTYVDPVENSYEEAEDDGMDASGEYSKGGNKKFALRVRRKTMEIVSTMDRKLIEYAEVARELNPAEFSKRKRVIEARFKEKSGAFL